ncbi:hypothetical protein [Novosphingobium sp.]|uniref:hypothetical protein n=1 Tax=Novosphingobium sp. TaxID=1874826 RepID=UPI0035B48DC4
MIENHTVANHFKYNAAANEIDLIEAEKRLDALLEKRSRLSERTTFGLLALNGASAVGTFSILQGSKEALNLIGIQPSAVIFSLVAFLLGMMFAVVGVWKETVHLTETAGKQFARTNALRNIKKSLSDSPRPEAIERLGFELDQLAAVPPMDFA